MRCSDMKQRVRNIDWYENGIGDEEDALLVCNPVDAVKFMDENDDILKSSMVIAEIVNPGTVYMIPAQEFLDYLEEGYA